MEGFTNVVGLRRFLFGLGVFDVVDRQVEVVLMRFCSATVGAVAVLE